MEFRNITSVIIANIVREMELFGSEKLKKDKRFEHAKALSSRIAETYRSFGVDAFGFGLNYAKEAGVVTQPVISKVLNKLVEAKLLTVKKHGRNKYFSPLMDAIIAYSGE